MTTMRRAEGATPSRLFKIPKLAEMRANGIMSFRINMAPCENGSKTGISRTTLSRLNDDTEATLHVLKNADWRSTKKKRATRASCSKRGRYGETESLSAFDVDPLVM